MNLITLDNITLSYGLDHLLDHIQLQISSNERLCLIGRNGAGKSSLMKIIEGTLQPDSGNIYRKPHLRIARLSQDLPQETDVTVYEYVSQALAETGRLLAEYYHLTHHLGDDKDLKQLERLQQAIDSVNGWQLEQRIHAILSRLSLTPETKVAELSGGWQRRAALAKALVVDPELLLLDEPTNHLDIEGIEWLQEQLLNSKAGLLFITHDRALLQRLATRIIELDRGNLTSWPGDYQNFLRRKEEMLHAEAKQNADFDKKLAQEEKWIRQGIKARRTRNEGRVRALEAMRLERQKRREVQGKTNFKANLAKESGELVIEAEHITQEYQNKKVINDFSIRIMRGDRIGLLGPNGIGKSTLLNILLKTVPAQTGTVKHGTKLHIAYFDQLRAALDPEKTVIDNVIQGTETIEINGNKRHIISYLGDFLFTPQRARTPVKSLSGGECNRLLLAKLFSQPANLLVLDEPTNDLDIETLELLEELCSNFSGTLLIVSHDRVFLDNIVTSTLVFQGEGSITEYIGGYSDFEKQQKHIKTDVITKPTPKKTSAPKKLSFNEQKELNELPLLIEALEKQQHELQELTAQAEFYNQPQDKITNTLNQLNKLTEKLEATYQRWHDLEEKEHSIKNLNS